MLQETIIQILKMKVLKRILKQIQIHKELRQIQQLHLMVQSQLIVVKKITLYHVKEMQEYG